MTTALLFDFSWVLAFPHTPEIGSSAAFKKAQQAQQPWQKYLTLNQELIGWIEQVKNQYPSYIFSASSKQLLLEIEKLLLPPFKNLFSSKELHICKHQPSSYLQIASLIKIKPEQILFVDDNADNIKAARLAGLTAIEFESNQDFFKQIEKVLQLKV